MKTEVRRGRKFVEYIDDSLPVGTFVQEIGAHDVSYQDDSGNWHPADENWETDGQDGFSFRAHRMNHKVRFDSIGAWRWYPRRNVETEYIVINRPQCWLTATKRWGNLLVNGISREGRDITLTSVRKVTRVIHSRWNGIKTDWILLDSTAPTKFRQQIDLVGLTELDGWLYGADGEKVALLTPTTAIGADGAELPCSGSYADGYLQFEADVTGAVYPVTVDPDFAGGTEDCVITGACALNAGWSTARSTSTSIGAAKPHAKYVGYYNSGAGSGNARFMYRAYELFDTSAIGAGSTVSQVNLRLVCLTDQSDVVDFDVRIAKYDWSELAGDLTNATKRETAYDGLLAADADSSIWRNTNGISTNTQYTSGNLSTTWVNKTGVTYYGLIADFDQDDSEPTQGYSRITIANAGNATESYRPCLIVAYSEGGGAQNLTLSCAAGSYSLTGTDATLTVTRAAQNLTLSCGAGSLALTGSACTLSVKRNYTLACAAGSYALTGTNATFTVTRNYTIACNAGSYSQTGTAATFAITRAYTLTASAGSYTLTGSAISFGNTKAYSLTANAGSYALTGSGATFTVLRNYTLALGAGSYALTGSDVTLDPTLHYTLACGAGSYALTGSSVTPFAALKPATDYMLTDQYFGWFGFPVNYFPLEATSANVDYSLALGMGSYVLVGTDAGLYILTITPACRTYFIDAENRTLLIESEDRTHSIDAENRTMEVRCH